MDSALRRDDEKMTIDVNGRGVLRLTRYNLGWVFHLIPSYFCGIHSLRILKGLERLASSFDGLYRASNTGLTAGCEHDFDEGLVGDVAGRVDELQHVGRAVVVPEQQDALAESTQPVVGDLEDRHTLLRLYK